MGGERISPGEEPRAGGTDLPPSPPRALGGIRICDFSGQLAGAGATRFLAAMGAEVIRVEDPVTQGSWDVFAAHLPLSMNAEVGSSVAPSTITMWRSSVSP